MKPVFKKIILTAFYVVVWQILYYTSNNEWNNFTTTLASALNAHCHYVSLIHGSHFIANGRSHITIWSLIHHTETESNDRRCVYAIGILTQHLIKWLYLFAIETPKAHIQLVSIWFGSALVTFSVAYCTLQLLLLLRLIFLTSADDISPLNSH